MPKTWKELESQVTPEVAEWVLMMRAAADELIEAQKDYIRVLEMKLLDHGDLEHLFVNADEGQDHGPPTTQ